MHDFGELSPVIYPFGFFWCSYLFSWVRGQCGARQSLGLPDQPAGASHRQTGVRGLFQISLLQSKLAAREFRSQDFCQQRSGLGSAVTGGYVKTVSIQCLPKWYRIQHAVREDDLHKVESCIEPHTPEVMHKISASVMDTEKRCE